MVGVAERRLETFPPASCVCGTTKVDSLCGLEGINVAVILTKEARDLGLSEDVVRTQVERRLEQDGIPVVSTEEYTKAPIVSKTIHDFVAGGYAAMEAGKHPQKTTDYGRLQVEVAAVGTEYPLAGTVRVTLCQTALLPATLPDQVMVVPCITWLDGSSGIYSTDSFAERISKSIEKLAGGFCGDYVAAHRKGRGQ